MLFYLGEILKEFEVAMAATAKTIAAMPNQSFKFFWFIRYLYSINNNIITIIIT